MKKSIIVSSVLILAVFFVSVFYKVNQQSQEDNVILKKLYDKEYKEFSNKWQELDDEDKERLLPEATDILLFLFQESIKKDNIEMMENLEDIKTQLLRRDKNNWREEVLQSINNYKTSLIILDGTECFNYNLKKLGSINDILTEILTEDLITYYNTGNIYFWNNYVDAMDYVYYFSSFKECDYMFNHALVHPSSFFDQMYDLAYIGTSDFSKAELTNKITGFIEFNDALINQIEEYNTLTNEILSDSLTTLELMRENEEYINKVSLRYE